MCFGCWWWGGGQLQGKSMCNASTWQRTLQRQPAHRSAKNISHSCSTVGAAGWADGWVAGWADGAVAGDMATGASVVANCGIGTSLGDANGFAPYERGGAGAAADKPAGRPASGAVAPAVAGIPKGVGARAAPPAHFCCPASCRTGNCCAAACRGCP
eukprot:32124-Chlamydomonas_euryale.AAC.1